MLDDRLPKSAAELREQGRRRRWRLRLRWEDCVKRDVKKAGEEEDWKKKTRDRGGWKRLSDEVVKKLRAAPHPGQREKEKERCIGKLSKWFRNILSDGELYTRSSYYAVKQNHILIVTFNCILCTACCIIITLHCAKIACTISFNT